MRGYHTGLQQKCACLYTAPCEWQRDTFVLNMDSGRSGYFQAHGGGSSSMFAISDEIGCKSALDKYCDYPVGVQSSEGCQTPGQEFYKVHSTDFWACHIILAVFHAELFQSCPTYEQVSSHGLLRIWYHI